MSARTTQWPCWEGRNINEKYNTKYNGVFQLIRSAILGLYYMLLVEYLCRDVQYVHCVMHKCIMVKLGGNDKHIKYVKKHVNSKKSWGEFAKVGGEKKISRNREKMY